MSGICDAYSKSTFIFDILHSLVALREVKSDSISLLHRAPGGVHNIYGAVLIVGRDH